MMKAYKAGWLKQGEQKPATEPRFKVDDWIIQENIGVYKVIEICESWYEVIDGEHNHYSISFDKEHMCHLWDISDAKDGDVLAFNDDTIVVFKNLYNSTTFHSYCHIEDGIFNISKDEMPDWWEGKGFVPATEEQRDILFAKMKEKGYEWDAEKKELKKIEKKLTWSEEDKKVIHCLEYTVRHFYEYEDTIEWCCNWLKSLKERVQPKQEWSEQEQVRINRIVSCLENLNVADNDILLKDVDWLKSLRTQR